jgi:hypothetical protein
MSTDLSQPVTIVNPTTGEALTLESSTEDLGRYLADVREAESLLREATNYVSAEILQRQDAAASWTTHVNGLTLTGASPAPSEEFDELALRESLWQLVDEGVITVEAADNAVETVVTYRVRKAGITALRKLGGRVADAINQHATEVPKRRSVRVERS